MHGVQVTQDAESQQYVTYISLFPS